MSNVNKKLPDSKAQWEYPYNHVVASAGGHEMFFNTTPNKESYRLFQPDGTFVEVATDGTVTQLQSNAHYNVSSQGMSHSIEAALDIYSRGGSRTNNFGGTHAETGNNSTLAIYGSQVNITKQQSYQHVVEGAHHIVSEVGTFHWDNDEHQHHNVAGDKVTFIGGTKYEQVNKEHGTHVPNGNMDIQIDQGKFRLSSGNDILIQSASSITLQVGQNKIIVNQSGIEIIATGNIVTNGATTKIQGGGVLAPPTTFS